jgi:hypothetical protein
MSVVMVAAVIYQRKLNMVQQFQGGWIGMVRPITDKLCRLGKEPSTRQFVAFEFGLQVNTLIN